MVFQLKHVFDLQLDNFVIDGRNSFFIKKNFRVQTVIFYMKKMFTLPTNRYKMKVQKFQNILYKINLPLKTVYLNNAPSASPARMHSTVLHLSKLTPP